MMVELTNALTLVFSFLIVYILIIAMTLPELISMYQRKSPEFKPELVRIFLTNNPAISLFCTSILGLAMAMAHVTVRCLPTTDNSHVNVTEMYVQDVGYNAGHLSLTNCDKEVRLKADARWKNKVFPTNILYVVTHRNGQLLSCYPKEDPSLVPRSRMKTSGE